TVRQSAPPSLPLNGIGIGVGTGPPGEGTITTWTSRATTRSSFLAAGFVISIPVSAHRPRRFPKKAPTPPTFLQTTGTIEDRSRARDRLRAQLGGSDLP